MSVDRALVIGAGGAVGHATVTALTAAGASVFRSGRERDATDPAQARTLLAEADPDLVVVADAIVALGERGPDRVDGTVLGVTAAGVQAIA